MPFLVKALLDKIIGDGISEATIVVGHMSDRTWNWLGRRRPYFLTGAILASIALVLMRRRLIK